MVNIKIHDSHQHTLNVHEMEIAYLSKQSNFESNKYVATKNYHLKCGKIHHRFKCGSKVQKKTFYTNNAAAIQKLGNILSFFFKLHSAHPCFVCLFFYWIGMQVPLFDFIFVAIGTK